MAWDPFDEIDKMRKEMNKMFKDFFEKHRRSFPRIEKPLIEFQEPLSDIKETPDEVVITIDLPGVDKKDIQLLVRDDILEVKAQKKREVKIDKKGFHKHERSYAGFHRILTLPASVKSESIKADYKNGVLKVTIPKKEKEKIKNKKIMIK
jgi:HSP20 family protein